jgi:hypothetical protein
MEKGKKSNLQSTLDNKQMFLGVEYTKEEILNDLDGLFMIIYSCCYFVCLILKIKSDFVFLT